MPNLVICLTILRFVLFGPRDPPTSKQDTSHCLYNRSSCELWHGILYCYMTRHITLLHDKAYVACYLFNRINLSAVNVMDVRGFFLWSISWLMDHITSIAHWINPLRRTSEHKMTMVKEKTLFIIIQIFNQFNYLLNLIYLGFII